jgi:hypothetical protein
MQQRLWLMWFKSCSTAVAGSHHFVCHVIFQHLAAGLDSNIDEKN